MANRQIYQLDPRTLSTTDYFATQDAYGLQEAGNNTIQDIIDLVPAADTSGLVSTSSFNSWTGSAGSAFAGTAAVASFVNLVQGPGISVNGLAITASVRAVNGKFPTANGNIQVALSATITGTSASLVSSGSGAITASLADGLIWIVANDPNPVKNGLVYIYSSGSTGYWYPIAPLDAAAIDAAYLRLDGTNGPLQGNVGADGFNITDAGTISATRLTGSLASSYIDGPHGTNSILSASYAGTASYVLGGTAFPYTGEALITGSLQIIAGTGNFGSGSLRASRIGVPTITAPTLQPVNTAYTNYVWQTNVNNNINWRSFPLVYGAGTSTVAGAYTGDLSGLDYEQIIGLGLKIGEAYVSSSTYYAPAQYIWRDPNTSLPIDSSVFGYPKPSYRTIISDNSSIGYASNAETSTMTAIVAANGRNHVLVVSGSMLARDGVSLGTVVSNQHYITGSVNVSGSLTVNSGTAITNAGDTYTSTAAVTKVVSLTAAEYSGITPDANTLYVVI